MSANRISIALSLLKGFAVSVVVTLLGMLVIAGFAVMTDIPDGLLTTLNQLLKGLAILLGVCSVVDRGGTNGFVKGSVLALIYMMLGYGLYVTLSGAAYSVTGMLGEMLMGAAIGGVYGAILVNMKPKSRRRHA